METGDLVLLKNYSNNNDYLTKIVSELENIISELNSKKKIEIIITQIKTLITTAKNMIESNKKDFDKVKNFVENMSAPKVLSLMMMQYLKLKYMMTENMWENLKMN